MNLVQQNGVMDFLFILFNQMFSLVFLPSLRPVITHAHCGGTKVGVDLFILYTDV